MFDAKILKILQTTLMLQTEKFDLNTYLQAIQISGKEIGLVGWKRMLPWIKKNVAVQDM